MNAFATRNDIEVLWRHMTDDESKRAYHLLDVVSDMLRVAAHDVGKDLDEMCRNVPGYASTARAVTVDVVTRILRQATTGEAMAQVNQSALGYNFQGTYAVPGGGMANAIMNNDLKRLGLRRQRIGVIEYAQRDNHPACHADGN